jgi:glycosyltransferase involved in cell wall biosynthesis
MSPRVSVVCIFLDAVRFLEEAIESVLAQTFQRWELLLVDDGSADGSTEIARRYERRGSGKIRYLEHEAHRNRGKSVSRNVGVASARGEYVSFLDADDVFLPSKLERQVGLLDAYPEAGMTYGPTLYWHGWTDAESDRHRDFIPELGVPPGRESAPTRLLTRFLASGGVVPCTCALLVRRECLERVGGFEESIPHLYEDQVLIAKLCLSAPVFVEGDCGAWYRQHPDSSSNAAIRTGEYHPLRPNPARQRYLAWLEAYLIEQGIVDGALWRSVRRELLPYRHPVRARLGAGLRAAGAYAIRRLRKAAS